MVNHPVHFVTKKGTMSPSAMIPFCGFGRNMTGMGVKIEHFDIPVCNSFQAKIFNDQLCYEVDLNRFDTNNLKGQHRNKELGISFYVDTNNDKMFSNDAKDSNFVVHVDTISK